GEARLLRLVGERQQRAVAVVRRRQRDGRARIAERQLLVNEDRRRQRHVVEAEPGLVELPAQRIRHARLLERAHLRPQLLGSEFTQGVLDDLLVLYEAETDHGRAPLTE